MDHLTKQQIVLLTLLVSFVTSLATGIFTVSLMDQAPREVVQTINQVVERTIDKAVNQNASVLTSENSTINQLKSALDKVSRSMVKIRSASTKEVVAFGLIVDNKGTILSDKSSIAKISDFEIVMNTGYSMPVSIIQSQIEGDIVFLFPAMSTTATKFVPISVASSTSIGQDIFTVFGLDEYTLSQGIISQTPRLDSGIKTTIPDNKKIPSSPLFDIHGNIIGINFTNSETDGNSTEFYNINKILSVSPKF